MANGQAQKNFYKIFQAVLASAKDLPFSEDTFSAVSCISAIEHFPADSDKKAVKNIGRF